MGPVEPLGAQKRAQHAHTELDSCAPQRPPPADDQTYTDRQELESRKEPVRLDGKVAIRRLDPVRIGHFSDRVAESQPPDVPADMFDDRVRENEIVTATQYAVGQAAGVG